MTTHGGTFHGTHPEDFVLKDGTQLWSILLDIPERVAHAFLVTADKKWNLRVKNELAEFKFFPGAFAIFRAEFPSGGPARLLAVHRTEMKWCIIAADAMNVERWVKENPETTLGMLLVKRGIVEFENAGAFEAEL